IKSARREVEGGKRGDVTRGRSLFIAESNERLQDMLRSRFKEHGFRVLLSADPMRALDRFRQQPYDVLIVNGETTGEDGVMGYERVLAESLEKRIPCAAILILGRDQAARAEKVARTPKGRVLVQPLSWKRLWQQVQALLGEAPDGKTARRAAGQEG